MTIKYRDHYQDGVCREEIPGLIGLICLCILMSMTVDNLRSAFRRLTRFSTLDSVLQCHFVFIACFIRLT